MSLTIVAINHAKPKDKTYRLCDEKGLYLRKLHSLRIKYKRTLDHKPWKLCSCKICLTAGVDYISHQAALGSVPRSIADPLKSINANVTGFANLFEAARHAGVKKLFIHLVPQSTVT